MDGKKTQQHTHADREIFIFPAQLTTYVQDWQPYPVDPYFSCYLCEYIYIQFLSLVPLLNPSLANMSSAGYCHARFLLSAFFSFLFFSDRVRPQFVLVKLPLSCDHNWIHSGPVNNVR